MNLATAIVFLVVAAMAAAAIIVLRRQGASGGGCSCGNTGGCNGACSGCMLKDHCKKNG